MGEQSGGGGSEREGEKVRKEERKTRENDLFPICAPAILEILH